MKKLFTQFSFPGGISSHVAPTTPGSIHEGGELGYSLSHAFGAVFDNPGLIVACIVGDGEAETGPLATAWQSTKLLDPVTDGAVLPILHLNGFKISNPTLLSRISHEELEQFLRGCGWSPYFVEGDDPETMHALMAETLDKAIAEIKHAQEAARSSRTPTRPRWPVIVLRSPKGWTGPKIIDGLKIEGTFRAHQVPILVDAKHPDHVADLEGWMRSYRADELFDKDGALMPELAALAPTGDRRMGANPHANGGLLLRDLRMPDFRDHAVLVPSPGAITAQDTMVLGKFLRDVAALNQEQRNFRIFGPDETLSNLLGAVFEVTNRQWNAVEIRRRVPRTRRPCRRLDAERTSMRGLPGRLPADRPPRSFQQLRSVHPHRRLHVQPARQVAEGNVGAALAAADRIVELPFGLPCLAAGPQRFHAPGPGLSRPCRQQEGRHRPLLPACRCQLPAVGVRPLPAQPALCECRGRGKARFAAVVDDGTGRHSLHRRARYLGWASNDQHAEPDVVMASCGDTPTLESMAAVSILRQHLPNLRLRVVNVVDLMRLQPEDEHPHGLSAVDYDQMFTRDRPIVFAFHGYAGLVHRLTYRRTNRNMHVRGYKEEGTITTAFDIRVQNGIDRFHLVMDVLDHVPNLGTEGAY